MKLSNFAQSRENNFNLIRIAAALAVLITHSFVLATGRGETEPLRESLDITMGTVAVDIFFVISGFLVTVSLLNRQSIVDFAWARCLRVFPALLVMLLLTVFVLGVFFTSLPRLRYLTSLGTYAYLLRCATLVGGIRFPLPGVFEGNPYPGTVNGSLWTMPYEVRMYALLAVLWVVARCVTRSKLRLFQIAVVSTFAAACAMVIARRFSFTSGGGDIELLFMFFSGATFCVLKERIRLYHSLFWLFAAAMVASAVTNKQVFSVVYMLTLAYLVFYMAYIPRGYIRKYNQIGDYSYGVYIYAFPVQQSVAALVPGVSVSAMIASSAVVTLLLAVLSWHLLEHRALRLKAFCIHHTSEVLFRDRTGR